MALYVLLLASCIFQSGCRELDEKLTQRLCNRILRDDNNRRLQNGIGSQHDRAHLLTFAEPNGVEPTNNQAGRILRAAIIVRTVSPCSQNHPVRTLLRPSPAPRKPL